MNKEEIKIEIENFILYHWSCEKERQRAKESLEIYIKEVLE